ncbi:MAG: VCBS domain-containing protein [Kordiimonadaceae bacterium]|nr:VCBS domain-containing protein [Kordiimonadaceae bacterium]
MPSGNNGNGGGNSGGNGNGPGDNGTDDDDVIDATSNKINGGDGADTITGTSDADRVNAGDGDDVITGGAGDDTMYGNDGNDTAIFSGDIRNYVFAAGKGNSFIVDGDDGTDTLKHIDTLIFDNYILNIDGANNAALVNDHAMTVPEDGDNSTDLLAGAWDYEGDSLTVTSVSDGVLNGSTLTFDAADSFEYLAEGETAEVVVAYTVSDGTDASDGTVTVTVEGANDAPVASGVGNTGEVTEDSETEQSATGTVEATDVDTSDELVWSGDAVGSYGSVTVDDDGNWEYTLDNDNAAVQALDANSDPLQDIFTLTVSDGLSTTTEEITISINGVDEETVPEISEGNLDAPGTANGSVAQAGWYNSANPDHSDYWYVTLEAGTVVTIQVDRIETSLDPALFVFQGTIDDPLATFGTNIDFGSEAGYIGFADDEIWRNDGPYGDPLFTFTVPETGQYTFIVTNYLSGGDHGGDFEFDYAISVDVA